MKGMIADGVDFPHAFEDIRSRMVDLGYKAMLHSAEAAKCCSEFDSEALQPQTDSKDGEEMVVVQMPEVTNHTDIRCIVRRTWTGSDYDCFKILEAWPEFFYG